MRVVVEYAADEVRVEVVDDGSGPRGRPPAGGHSLVGMRERAALYGGQVTTGANAGGGFVVRAVLPLAPATGDAVVETTP